MTSFSVYVNGCKISFRAHLRTEIVLRLEVEIVNSNVTYGYTFQELEDMLNNSSGIDHDILKRLKAIYTEALINYIRES